MADTLIDGPFLRPEPVGPKRYEYPFRMNGDRVSAFFEEDVWQTEKTFSPEAFGTAYSPALGDFYFVREADPRPMIASLQLMTRMYSRVPTPQITYSSRAINKPTVPNEATTTWSLRTVLSQGVEIATAVRNNTGFWTSDDRVFAPFYSQVTAVSKFPATAGTFTLTYKTSTTAALAYNCSNATAAAAVNGLAAIIADGITVTVTMGIGGITGGGPSVTITATAGSFAQAISMDGSGLTMSTGGGAAKLTFTQLTSSTGVLITLGRTITAAAHGLTNGVSLVAMTNQGSSIINGLVYTSSQWSVYDANTIAVMEDYTAASAALLYLASYRRNYTPGATVLSSRTTETFYLPLVTAGITTAANIPITVPNISDGDIIAAVLGVGGFQAVDFQGPAPWKESAIFRTALIEIDFDDL